MSPLVIGWPVLGALGSLCWEMAELVGSLGGCWWLVACGGRFQVALSFLATATAARAWPQAPICLLFKNMRRVHVDSSAG